MDPSPLNKYTLVTRRNVWKQDTAAFLSPGVWEAQIRVALGAQVPGGKITVRATSSSCERGPARTVRWRFHVLAKCRFVRHFDGGQ